jgi:CheY-like chemotaxis protein
VQGCSRAASQRLDSRPSEVETPGIVIPGESKGGYVLVVGGAELSRQEVDRSLRAMGFAVTTLDVDAGLALSHLTPPRLMVLDSDGVAGWWRQLDRVRLPRHLRQTPLVVLNSDGSAASFALAIAHGASACLAKPVSADVLSSVVNTFWLYDAAGLTSGTRQYARRPLLVPADVEVERQRRGCGWIMDASRSGCRIETAEALSAGNTIRLWLPKAEATARLPLTGATVWTRQHGNGQCLAGIQFSGATPVLAALALGIEMPSST